MYNVSLYFHSGASRSDEGEEEGELPESVGTPVQVRKNVFVYVMCKQQSFTIPHIKIKELDKLTPQK